MDWIPNVISALVIVILALVWFLRNKKNGNPGSKADIDHAVIKEKLDNINDTLQRIEDKLESFRT